MASANGTLHCPPVIAPTCIIDPLMVAAEQLMQNQTFMSIVENMTAVCGDPSQTP
jgi:hypothetical protein